MAGVGTCVVGILACVMHSHASHGRALVLAGLVQVGLSKLGLRVVGFQSSAQISLPLLERGGKRLATGKTAEREGRDTAAKRELRVLSHNVWCHYMQQWYAPPASKRLECLFEAIQAQDYDVVLVQELFLFRVGPLANTHSFEVFTRAMLGAGYHLASDPRSSLPVIGQNNGLAIFSKLDVSVAPVSRSFVATGESVCVKGFVHARLSLGGGRTLHVVTTHLDSKQKPKAVQDLQARQIRSEVLDVVLGGVEGVSGAVLVAGDFNICSRGSKDDGQGYQKLVTAMSPLVDLYAPTAEMPAVPTRRPDQKPFGGSKGGRKEQAAIDHAFVLGLTTATADVVDLRCRDKTIVSDHFGLDMRLIVQ